MSRDDMAKGEAPSAWCSAEATMRLRRTGVGGSAQRIEQDEFPDDWGELLNVLFTHVEPSRTKIPGTAISPCRGEVQLVRVPEETRPCSAGYALGA